MALMSNVILTVLLITIALHRACQARHVPRNRPRHHIGKPTKHREDNPISTVSRDEFHDRQSKGCVSMDDMLHKLLQVTERYVNGSDMANSTFFHSNETRPENNSTREERRERLFNILSKLVIHMVDKRNNAESNNTHPQLNDTHTKDDNTTNGPECNWKQDLLHLLRKLVIVEDSFTNHTDMVNNTLPHDGEGVNGTRPLFNESGHDNKTSTQPPKDLCRWRNEIFNLLLRVVIVGRDAILDDVLNDTLAMNETSRDNCTDIQGDWRMRLVELLHRFGPGGDVRREDMELHNADHRDENSNESRDRADRRGGNMRKEPRDMSSEERRSSDDESSSGRESRRGGGRDNAKHNRRQGQEHKRRQFGRRG